MNEIFSCATLFLKEKIVRVLVLAVKFFTAKRVVNQAAALTYSTLLAIVPIMAVVFAIARGFGYNKYIEVWFKDTLQSQPQVADIIVGFVNSYLVRTRSGVFLGVGLIFMLYTVLMLVNNIELAFNNIWQVKKPRSLFRTFTDYMAMLFALPIFIVFTSGLSIFVATFVDSMADMELISPLLRFLVGMSPYVLMSLLFMAFYMFMPNTHVRFRNVIAPGILAGVAMQWLQLVYIHSQIWVSSYNAIYGSFAALPMFMLWIQISWIICLFGAELCYTSQYLDHYDYNASTDDISLRYRMMLSLIILARICRHFDHGKGATEVSSITTDTGIPIRVVNDLLYRLSEAGLIIETTPDEKGDTSRFIPAMSTDKLSVGVALDRLESSGKWMLNLSLDNLDAEVMMKLIKMRHDYLDNLRSVLLRDM